MVTGFLLIELQNKPIVVAILPVIELAERDAQPADESAGGQLRLAGPEVDEVDDLVAVVVGGPLAVQIRPRLFFSSTCSPMSSARTSFFCWSLACRAWTFWASEFSWRALAALESKTAAPSSKSFFCQR